MLYECKIKIKPHFERVLWYWSSLCELNLESTHNVWNAKAEKIQDIENHTKTTVLNQENNISYPRRLYITAINSIHVQDVVNTCVTMKIYKQE